MEFLPIQDYSNIWDISKRRIQILCKEGRVPGAKMIGNMWVIPEGSDRPNDARYKTPITRNMTRPSSIRKKLKELLKNLYTSCTKHNFAPMYSKDYVLSIIASVLFSYYAQKEVTDELLSRIYNDISSNDNHVVFNKADIDLVKNFVHQAKEDPELDDILSWSYQYSNKHIKDNEFSKTQFFTEKYMINYLVENIENIEKANKILDPCVGGGNFLARCLEEICKNKNIITQETLIRSCSLLYGYDIDNKITRIAVVNIKLRALAILQRNGIVADTNIWEKLCPNIYMSSDYETIQGSLTKENRKLINVISNSKQNAKTVLGNADFILTNPPFASIKGMKQEQKDFLKNNYPLSHCDTCVAFIEAIGKMLKENGTCGIVSQNAWMHLSSFCGFREWAINNYNFIKIINLGSGAFQDLSGEKSNVSLIIFSKSAKIKNSIGIANIKATNYFEKTEAIRNPLEYIYKNQKEINSINGFDFSEDNLLDELGEQKEYYRDIAVPMQGTSTGNAKELVGFFWEHFKDPDWVSVSNGGGYSRWQGLNNSVVKWGNNGEYIKAQKGSALRNVKYFPETQLVFSDTGTAGLNVRLLHKNQIFIASGPGIRVKKGNEFAHMALLNSRIASYCIRQMSPKLTIAAGYIGQIPINEKISSSVVLEKNARLCVDLKEKMLSIRTSNIEYSDNYFQKLPDNLDDAAWYLFNEDITNELMKLEIESKIDVCLSESYGLSNIAQSALDNSVGKCAYRIDNPALGDVDFIKLDKYIDKIIDNNCCLKRTKNSKYALGSDGYLEYISKDLNINPEIIVQKIQEKPYKLVNVINKYKDLLLHNYVLHYMGYNTNIGVALYREKIDRIVESFSNRFNAINYGKWIKNNFNRVHADIFKGVPYLIYENGEIYTNDKNNTK